MKLPIYSKLERAKTFIKYFVELYSPVCCFCKFSMDWKVFFPKFSGLDRDDWTIHHLNHNREINKPQNLALCHRECHRRHHRLEQLFKEQNPKKKFVYTAYIAVPTKQQKIFKV